MIVKGSKSLLEMGNGKRVFLSAHELETEHKGKTGRYFMIARGATITPPEEKKPDAVVIVAIHKKYFSTIPDKRIVITNEFRPAIGCRELGFPAGLIDAQDYENRTIREAAIAAATRELREETGLTLMKVIEVSPVNCYSSAGLTNESVCFVICEAEGEPTNEGNEASEDIEVMLVSQDDLANMVHSNPTSLAYSKTAWPMMWAFAKYGFPGG